MIAPLRIGAFAHPSPPRRPGAPIFGAYSAIKSGQRALLQHSKAEAVHFYCSPPALDMLREETRQARGGPSTTLRAIRDLIARPANINAWLDLGGDTTRPHRFRRRIKGRYPIAVVHHSVSYGYTLHQWFLPLLLEARPGDSVICTSPSARRVIQQTLDHLAENFNAEYGTRLAYQGRLDDVPLGVDVEHFRPIPQTEARKKIGVAQDETLLLWLGRLSAMDKADLGPLLRVFRNLAQERPKLRLLLAGSARADEFAVLGRMIAALGIQSRVTAVPPVDDATLPYLYGAADIFVSPVDSIQEMFGLTVIEAMACGIPVVCSDWGGYRDSVTEETGVLVPTIGVANDAADDYAEWSLPFGELLDQFCHAQSVAVDPIALQHSLADLIEHPAARREMGRRAREHVLQQFAWPGVVARWDALLTELRDTNVSNETLPRPYYRPRLAETFSHYPTTPLTDETVIEGLPDAPTNADPWKMGIVSTEIAQAIWNDLTRGPAEVGALALRHPPGAKRHIAWLIKYGHARIRS